MVTIKAMWIPRRVVNIIKAWWIPRVVMDIMKTLWIPRMVGAKTLINVDGEDWARDKWSGFAKTYQKWCERVACRSANIVVADAKGILARYKKLYNHETIFVPYGANIRSNLRLPVKGWQVEAVEGSVKRNSHEKHEQTQKDSTT